MLLIFFEGKFTVTWGVDDKHGIYADMKMSTLDRAAALIAVAAWDGDEGRLIRG